MTDLNQVESEIRDLDVETNEVVEETLEEAKAPAAKGKPDADATTEPESIASVDKAAKSTSKTAPPKPKTKAAMVNDIMMKTSKMKKEELTAAYGRMFDLEESFDLEDDEELDTAAELSAIVEGEATLSGITIGLNLVKTAFLSPSLVVTAAAVAVESGSDEAGATTYWLFVGWHVVTLVLGIILAATKKK